MNRSRVFLRSALTALAMIALAGATSTAHAQAPTTADPAAATTAPAATAPAATAPASNAPATTPATTPASTAPDVTLDAPSPSHRTAWPWIIIGAGIALVVTATVLEVHAVSEDDQRQNAEIKLTGLSPGDPQHQPLVDSAASHDKSATTSRTEALIIGSVGFVAIAGAVVLWFVEGGSSASASSANGAPANATHAKRTMPSIVPQLTPGYAGAMLGASF